jgi:hypothetical protein
MGQRHDFFYNGLQEDLIRGMYCKEKNEEKVGEKGREKHEGNENQN